MKTQKLTSLIALTFALNTAVLPNTAQAESSNGLWSALGAATVIGVVGYAMLSGSEESSSTDCYHDPNQVGCPKDNAYSSQGLPEQAPTPYVPGGVGVYSTGEGY